MFGHFVPSVPYPILWAHVVMLIFNLKALQTAEARHPFWPHLQVKLMRYAQLRHPMQGDPRQRVRHHYAGSVWLHKTAHLHLRVCHAAVSLHQAPSGSSPLYRDAAIGKDGNPELWGKKFLVWPDSAPSPACNAKRINELGIFESFKKLDSI